MSLFEPIRSIFNLFLGKHKSYKFVQKFEDSYQKHYGHKDVIAISHARVALYYCIRSYKYEDGDEVLMTPINIPDMVNMIRIAGLKERFVDINEKDFSVDLNDVKKKITSRSKFLFVTHLNGFVPDMDKIKNFAKENNLILIQDCTQNVGAKFNGQNLEAFSDLSVSALCDLKVIHTHMGGVVISNSETQSKKIKDLMNKELAPLSFSYFSRFLIEDTIATLILNRCIFTFFINPALSILNKVIGEDNIEAFTKGEGLKLGPVYLFKGLFGGGGNLSKSEIPDGMLYKFSDLQAQIGLRRLELCKDLDLKRISNSITLRNSLNIDPKYLFHSAENSNEVYWKFPLRTQKFRDLQKKLLSIGIDSARSNLIALNDYDCFSSKDLTPVASKISKETLCIPAHPYLSSDDMEKAAKCINQFFEK
jgi:dTDP-4-amino-4,6-dideoxygalactose transaminase